MADLGDLYQSVILDHNRSPRNFREIAGGRHADGHNPLCGDRLTVWADVKDESLDDVSFQGDGCAISKASASLMTEAVKGKSREEIERMVSTFQQLVTGKLTPEEAKPVLGKLVLFAGVSEFPVRVKCASLAWHTLRAALKDEELPVTTE